MPGPGNSWTAHLTGAAIAMQPVQRIDDPRWVWHIGLDAEASTRLNDLDQGLAIDQARHAGLLALVRLELRDRRTCSSAYAGGRSTSASR